MSKKEQFTSLMKSGKTDRILFYPILMHFAARYNSHTYGEFASDFKVFKNLFTRESNDLLAFSQDFTGFYQLSQKNI